MPYSNAAKTQNALKLAGVPQSGKPTSATSGLKFSNIVGTSGGHIAA